MPEVPYKVEKPWGYELIWARTDRYVGKIIHIKAGHALSVQYHERKDETVYLLSGELRQGSPTFLPKTWASVDDVFVEPEYRNRGMGRALLKSVQSWAQERGADGISLQVAAANSRGRKFYEDLGFRDVSVYKVLEFE